MPNPNAIISTTIRLEPPLDRAPDELLRIEGGVSVQLEDRRVRLDPENPRSAGFAQVLDGLSKLGMPVYVEIDPATNVATRVLVPAVGRIVSVNAADDDLDVELDTSHARHVLRRGEPDSTELERELRNAMTESRPVIVVEDDAHNIIDIRAFTPAPDLPLPPFPAIPHPRPRLNWPLRLLRWIWWVICWPWWWWRCPSGARAQQVFDAMAATSCNPLTVPLPCIPFLYPDDGCWARAHEMCRLMIGMGLSPRKVWID